MFVVKVKVRGRFAWTIYTELLLTQHLCPRNFCSFIAPIFFPLNLVNIFTIANLK
jgi:hypothetical protein